MSADMHLDCPICGGQVRIYHVHEIELHKSGEIEVGVTGSCGQCDKEFRSN